MDMMRPTQPMHRREFLTALGATLATGCVHRGAGVATGPSPLSFSTLGCPNWTWAQILDFARAHEFAAIELRHPAGDGSHAAPRVRAGAHRAVEARGRRPRAAHRVPRLVGGDARAGEPTAHGVARRGTAVHRPRARARC